MFLWFRLISSSFIIFLQRGTAAIALAHFTTSRSASQSVYLIEHVEGQEREAQIVDHQEASAGVRLPVFHVLGPHPHNQKVHDCECKCWWVVVQQQPSPHPLI